MDYPLFLPSRAVTRLLTPAEAVVDEAAAAVFEEAAAVFEEAAVDSEEVADSAEVRWAGSAEVRWAGSAEVRWAASAEVRWAASVVARPWVVFAERPASVRGPAWEWPDGPWEVCGPELAWAWPAALEWECARP